MKNRSKYSDEALLKLVSRDDEKAFEELFDRYWEKSHRIASTRLGSRETAQEIVLDVFLSFWQRRHTLQVDNFSHYLQGSLKNKIITHINRAIAQRSQFEDYQKQVSRSEDHTVLTVEYNDLERALEEKVRTLPEKTQEVFRLSRMEGRSVSEIAHMLNLSEKAIEYHITRSRKELRVGLKDFLMLVGVTISLLLHNG